MYDKLRKLRLEKDIPISDILRVLDLKVLSGYYNEEDRGIRFSPEEAKKLSSLFGMPIEEIFSNDEMEVKI